MKIEIKGTTVIATSETKEEAQTLFTLSQSQGGVRAHKPHKKHNHRKECEMCGEFFKGLQGLGIHKAKCKKAVINNLEPVKLT